MLSQSEENYLKAIYNIGLHTRKSANTNNIAKKLNTKASSVTDMIKKLSEKKLVNYQKYKGTSLTVEGEKIAIKIVRKHRLWEVFLVKKLHFNWDEVHDIAEQLEHIDSPELINKLDYYLNYPTKDPHGDPIPDANGKIRLENGILLNSAKLNVLYKISCVKDNSSTLLQFLDKHSINIDSELTVLEKFDFDDSITVKLSNGNLLTLSKKVCSNVFVNIK
jgi:DtxR family Mn-dependent transcriptional regulator